MRAAVWYGKKDIRVEEKNVADVQRNEVKVKVAWTGICGSDLHEYVAGPIIIPENEPDALTGKTAPLTMGHEFSGVIEEVGKDVTNLKVGDRVTVNPLIVSGKHDDVLTDMYEAFAFIGLNQDGGFADYVVVDEHHAIKLGDNVSLEEAALIEPTAVAVQAIKESDLKFGDNVAVFGAGPIGLLTIIAAKAAGAKDIFAFDLSEERLKKAEEVGATHIVNSSKEDPVAFIRKHYPLGVDISFEVAGVEPTFNQALASTRARGKLTVISIFEKGFDFHPMDLTTTGVHVHATLAYEPEVFKTTIEMINTGTLDPSPVITSHIELENIIGQGFEALLNDKSQAKILVKLSGEK